MNARLPGILLAVALGTTTALAQGVLRQQAELLHPSPGSQDRLGQAVALEGSTALLGAPNDDSVQVYELSGGTWSHTGELAPSTTAFGFGWSLDLCGDALIVGAPYDDHAGSQSGSAWVFTRAGTVWTEEARLVASDAIASQRFGWSVAIDSDHLFVGAPRDNGPENGTGAVYAYRRTGTTFTEVAKLVDPVAITGHELGSDVAIDGTTAIAGARGDRTAGTSGGSVYVYDYDGTSWSQQAKLVPTPVDHSARFGHAVALDGDRVAVGAPWANHLSGRGSVENLGRVYVFERTGTTWSQVARESATDAFGNDQLGSSVDLDGDRVLAGAMNDGGEEQGHGSAYLFERQVDATWVQVAKLTDLAPEPLADLGTAVALEGTTALVGAPRHGAADEGLGLVAELLPAFFASTCTGDGTGAKCPCTNGSPGRGCENAQGLGGIVLQLTACLPDGAGGGLALLTGGGFEIGTHPAAIAIRSPSAQAPVTFGDGLLCLQPPVVRFGATISDHGGTSHSVNHEAGAGSFHYQLWYRSNPASYCDPTAAFNTSNALEIVWN